MTIWFLLLPIVDILSLYILSDQWGGWNVFFYVVAAGFVGYWLITNQGWLTVARLQNAAVKGRAPEQALIKSVLHIGAGILFIFPGIVSDFFAVCLLLPGVNIIFAKWLQLQLLKAAQSGRAFFFTNMNVEQWNNDSYSANNVRDVTPINLPQSRSATDSN